MPIVGSSMSVPSSRGRARRPTRSKPGSSPPTAIRSSTCSAGGTAAGVGGVGDERARLAVADDVGGLVGREVPVHVGEPEPGAVARRPGLGELRPVAAEQRDRVALAEPAPAQGADELVGVGVQLAEGAVAGRRDDRRPMRVARRPERRRHAGAHGRLEGGGVLRRERGRHRPARAMFST